MKQSLLFSATVVALSAVLFTGCAAATPEPTTGSMEETTLDDKSGFTTLTGTLTGTGNTALLQSGGQNIGLESFDVDFTEYNGKPVTVTGKYSGDTLFVTEISQ